MAVQQITAKRVGDDVYLSFVVPAQNDDMTRPGVTRRIDVFGYTGFTEPPRGRFLDGAVLIASVPVAPAPPPAAPLPPAEIPQVTTEGAAHGSLVRLVDHLDPEELVDKPLPPLPTLRGRIPAAALVTRPVTLVNPVLRRFYMAIARSDRDYPSVASAVVELPLIDLPESPPRVSATVEAPFQAPQVLVSWEPSGGLIGHILDRQLAVESSPVDEPPRSAATASPVPDGPTRYNIYRRTAPDPLAFPLPAVAPSPYAVDLPVPLNPIPLDVLEYLDPVELDERHRCYTVRAVRGTGPAQIEGEPSRPVCATPIDIFGPAPPRGLVVIPGEGALTLSWDPNEDVDLGGYLVLRGEAGSATLLPLIDVPIAETRYTDRTVTPGVRYVYVVVAVDTRLPVPNRSEPSNPAEEQAR